MLTDGIFPTNIYGLSFELDRKTFPKFYNENEAFMSFEFIIKGDFLLDVM